MTWASQFKRATKFICHAKSAYFLHFCLKILDKQLAQIVQGLQLASNGVFKALKVLPSLLSSVKLSRQLCQSTWLLGLVMFQSLVVFYETIVCQLQLLVGTKMTPNSNTSTTVSRYKLKQCILALYATYKNLKICILNVNNVFIIKFLTNIRFRQRSGITALITHSVVSLMAACFSVISCLNSASWRWCCSRCDSICRSSASFICCADAIWSISLSFSANWDEYSWPVWNANSRIQLDDSALFILKKSNKTQNYTKQNKSTTTRKKQTHFTACIQWRSGWSSTRFIKNHLFTVIIISQVTFSNLLHILWNTASSLLPTLQIFTNYLLLCYLWPD